MRRGLKISLLGTIAVALLAIIGTLAAGNKPQLGLDLQGGLSVVLKPVNSTTSDVLDQTISIIRKRVDGLGVAEPEITRQGNRIVVELPGVKDQERAIELVGTTAELRFRPVLAVYPGKDSASSSSGSTTTIPGSATTLATGTTVAATSTSAVTPQSGAPGGALPLLAAETTVTTVTTAAPTTAAPTTVAAATTVPAATTTAPAATAPTIGGDGLIPLTPREKDDPNAQVVLPEIRAGKEVARYLLGPAPLTGSAVKTAQGIFSSGSNEWVTQVEFKNGANGIDGFNTLSISCFDATSTCPTRQTGIVLDGVVLSAPVPQTRGFTQNTIEISGASTSAKQAKDLGLALRYGALPVQLEREAVQTVSATLGKDSLRAGIIAGLVGVLLVIAFMTFYYKTLGGLVLLAGLCVSGSLLWSIISFLGQTSGLALTLSGTTGIIVSIGVTVDSYVVFFERLKDDVRSGKTLRSSVERGFQGAYRTIIAADSVSLLGAVVLWWLTVGSVRGFAFFLGLSTMLDMLVAFFFTRPLVTWLSRTGRVMRTRVFGVEIGEANLTTAPSAFPVRPRGGAK